MRGGSYVRGEDEHDSVHNSEDLPRNAPISVPFCTDPSLIMHRSQSLSPISGPDIVQHDHDILGQYRTSRRTKFVPDTA